MFNPSEGLASTAVVASIESAGRDRWKGKKRGRTEREKIPQGYGLYISLYIGDSFLIMPGQRRGPVHIANPSPWTPGSAYVPPPTRTSPRLASRGGTQVSSTIVGPSTPLFNNQVQGVATKILPRLGKKLKIGLNYYHVLV